MRSLCSMLLVVTALRLSAAELSIRAVAVTAEGAVVALDRDQLATPASLPAADHYWIWNDTIAARKVTRQEMEMIVAAGDPIGDSPRCLLRFSPARTAVENGLVRVAPAEMWAEIPEGLIPTLSLPKNPPFSIPVAQGEDLRLRVSMKNEGSSWIDVAPGKRETSILLTPAADHLLKVVDDAGRAVPNVRISILKRGNRAGNFLALLAGSDDGVVSLPAFPQDLEYGLVVSEKSHAPLTLRGTVRQLPERVTLATGAVLSGRLVDGEKKPVAGASVVAETWVSDDEAALFRKEVRSDAMGRWQIGQVPMRRVILAIRHEAYATKRTEIDVDETVVDLGGQALSPGITVRLKVVDDRSAPIPGASVRLQGDESDWSADAKGIAALTGIDALAELRGEIAAIGHHGAKFSFRPPFDRELLEVTVARGFEVEGRFVDERGAPLDEGKIRIQREGSYRVEDLDQGGRFRLTLDAGADYELAFASSSTGEALVRVARGDPGERRDLGEVRPIPGGAVQGRLVSVEQPDGLAGATIWCPRPSGAGPILAWLHGNIASARSDDNGAFELRGVPYAPISLRIDAPGHARRYINLTLVADQPAEQLGVLTLDRGVDFELAVDGAPDGAIAKLDLRGEWLDLDMLTAPVFDGVARFTAVPPGDVVVTVKSGRDVLCEARIAIPVEVASYRSDCQAETSEVVGRVTLGGQNAGSGTLTFASTEAAPSAAIISTGSPSGAVRQEVYGSGSPSRFAEVDNLGEFRLSGMRAGEWRVTWQANGAGPSPPRTVQVPNVRRFETTLDFPAGRISGRVIDSDRNPVPFARILELDGGAAALAGPDGSFRLGGLAPGRKRLQARLGERESDILETIIEPDREGSSELVLREGDANELRLRVLDTAGQPASGAMVFIDSFGSFVRIVTADAGGFATTRYSSAFPPAVRLAVFHKGGWLLTGTMNSDVARDGYVAQFRPQGTVHVAVSDPGQSLVRIAAPGAWELGSLLTTLGLRPFVSAATPLTLQLPEGDYDIAVGVDSKHLRVKEGQSTDIAFSPDAHSRLANGDRSPGR